MSQALTPQQQQLGAMLSPDTLAPYLPDAAALQRFVQSIMHLGNGNPAVLQCEPNSIVYCALQVAELGFDPNPARKEVWFIPAAGKCTIQFGYGAWLKPVRESGWAMDIIARCVYQGEPITLSEPTPGCGERNLVVGHLPTIGAGTIVGVLIRFVHPDKTTTTHWFTMDALKGITQARNTPAWKAQPDTMWIKTAIKRALKYSAMLIGSAALDRMIELDHESEAMVVDAQPSTPNATFATLPAPEPNPLDELHKQVFERVKVAKALGLELTDPEGRELVRLIKAAPDLAAMEKAFYDYTKQELPPL